MLACVKHKAKFSNVGDWYVIEIRAILYKVIKKGCFYKTTFEFNRK